MRVFRKAILIVHGFAGGVYDEEYLAHQLELVSNYDVYTFTLPGHDGDFSKKITANEWIKKAESEVEFLIDHGYDKIYVIGHSMGGVIATHLASKYSEIKKLVLVAPAFRTLGFENKVIDLKDAIDKAPKVFKQYGAQMIANRMMKLPVTCFIELIRLVKKYQNDPKKVSIPTLIFRGTIDNVVPQTAVEHVYDTLSTKNKKVVMLKNITHDVFREDKKDQATDLVIQFFHNRYSLSSFPDMIEKKDII